MNTKLCRQCNRVLLLSDYYKKSGRPCGVQSECKLCMRLRRREKNRKTETRRYRDKYPEKYKAHNAVNNAVRDGMAD